MIHGSGRSPGGGDGNPLQGFCLKNPVDRGAWRAIVHGVTESQGVTEHAFMDGCLMIWELPGGSNSKESAHDT